MVVLDVWRRGAVACGAVPAPRSAQGMRMRAVVGGTRARSPLRPQILGIGAERDGDPQLARDADTGTTTVYALHAPAVQAPAGKVDVAPYMRHRERRENCSSSRTTALSLRSPRGGATQSGLRLGPGYRPRPNDYRPEVSDPTAPRHLADDRTSICSAACGGCGAVSGQRLLPPALRRPRTQRGVHRTRRRRQYLDSATPQTTPVLPGRPSLGRHSIGKIPRGSC